MQQFGTHFLPPSKEGWFIPARIRCPTLSENLEIGLQNVLEELAPSMELPNVRVTSVNAEWQGFSPNTIKRKDLSDEDNFRILSETVKTGPVILSFHGGSYIRGNPTMERPATLKLAKKCGARILAVDYRLAPQYPFPAGLVDAVVAYLYLLHPPADALHGPIDPSRIVILGDSAGVTANHSSGFATFGEISLMRIGRISDGVNDAPSSVGSISFTGWYRDHLTMVGLYLFLPFCDGR